MLALTGAIFWVGIIYGIVTTETNVTTVEYYTSGACVHLY